MVPFAITVSRQRIRSAHKPPGGSNRVAPDHLFKPAEGLPEGGAGLWCGMKTANIIRGRIEAHAKGLGTVTPDMVERRAREIAVTNGRPGDRFTTADLEQARHELQASQDAPPESLELEAESSAPEDQVSLFSEREAPRKVPSDEQTLPEDLVQEGLDEAAHEQMLAGNQESRRKDKHFDDQLRAEAESE